jgi:serine/threonine-protein kinase
MDERGVEARIGSTLLGKWTLERLLGVGGMAAVYVGVHKIGRRDAIKILHPEVARAANSRARFELEAHAVNALHHPGAVEVHDIDTTEDGAPFLVMELLEGETLLQRVRRLGDIEPGELLRIVDELLDVLAAAHGAGIVHRDVKLDNLFIQADGRLKVLDFGIARMRPTGPALTMTGVALGTTPYMSPEQILGTKEIDGRSDLFAVGATMFRLIAKRKVHEAQSEQELIIKMATEPAPSLGSVAPDAPSTLCAVVDRALVFDRERRYPDAPTMQTDVRALRAGSDPPYATRMAGVDPPVASVKGSAVLPPTPETPTRAEGRSTPEAETRVSGHVTASAAPPSQSRVAATAVPSGPAAAAPMGLAALPAVAPPPTRLLPPTTPAGASPQPSVPGQPTPESRAPIPLLGALAGACLLMTIVVSLLLYRGCGPSDSAGAAMQAPADSAHLVPGAAPRPAAPLPVTPTNPSHGDPTPRPDPAPSSAPKPAPMPPTPQSPTPQGPQQGPGPGKGHGHGHGKGE